MKKRIIATLVASTLISAPVFADRLYYPDCGLVTEIKDETPIDYEDGVIELITITFQNGMEYQFVSDAGDWFRNDLVAVVMGTNGTYSVLDDEILDVKYVGWLSDEEALKWVK